MGPDTSLRGIIKAVIFDLDDTLVLSTVDFRKFRAQVIRRICEYDSSLAPIDPDELTMSVIGRYEAHLRGNGEAEPDIVARLAELDRIMDQVELERVRETRVIPGAGELLEMLRDRGIKRGVLTRGCAQYASMALEASGLGHLVDAVESRNSEVRPKPDPESYARLVRKMGVEKHETIFVGDHPIDARCAVNAGVTFIGVLTGDVPEDVLKAEGSAMVFADISELRHWLEESLQ